jgi:hypothetical protein
VCPNVLALPTDAVKNRIDLFVGKRIDPLKLYMKIRRVFWNIGQGIVDLIIGRRDLGGKIGECDLAAFAKWHLPIAIQAPLGIHTNRQRVDVRASQTAGKKIGDRTFCGRGRFAIPIELQDMTLQRA